ncbi:MAG: hypothetical protein EXR64_00520 [Dehalococcoidia bacterium]|nr:hypothetical protein [Dehalococcoidia bacterium]
MRLLRRLALLAIAVPALLYIARRLGVLPPSACAEACACTVGARPCRCGHATCLAPAPEA